MFTVPRRRGVASRCLVLLLLVALLSAAWWLADSTGRALTPPQPQLALGYYAINRNLKSYLDNIDVLIEPSSTVCSGSKQVDVLALVSSAPRGFERRQAIRDTWGSHVPSYFVLGLDGSRVEDLTADNYVEAKEHGDVIVFQFRDHYQNLTLKSALMMHWTATRCRSQLARLMLLKTDDDVLVNPWLLRRLLRQHGDRDLVGYRKLDNYLHRDMHSKWYIPRWLYWRDFVPEYLSGTGYLVRGSRLQEILNAAYETPIINLEDVYFTYLVSKLRLNLTLTHDHRLSPYKPWLPVDCVFWGLASTHSLSATEMLRIWQPLECIGNQYELGIEKCRSFVDNFWTEWLLY